MATFLLYHTEFSPRLLASLGVALQIRRFPGAQPGIPAGPARGLLRLVEPVGVTWTMPPGLAATLLSIFPCRRKPLRMPS